MMTRASLRTPRGWLATVPVGAGLWALALGGCEQKAPGAVERPPAAVVVATAVTRDVPVYLDAIGKLVAREVVSVQPQVSGRITAIHFKDGAEVAQGDRLFTIDPRPLQAALEQAEANVGRDLAQARAQLQQAQANLARDAAQLENARVQDARYAELVRKELVAREQYDQIHTALEAARATVRASTAMVDNAQAAITAAEAQLAQARAAVLAGQAAIENARAAVRADQAAVESARLQLAYTEIRAPIAGRAGQRLVDLGNVVTANTGSLLTIQRLDPIYADFTVTENDLTAVQQHLAHGTPTVEVRLPDEPDAPVNGTVTFLDTAVQDGTGTVKLRATLPNPSRRLWPGRLVKVRLILSRLPGAVLVPAAAPQVSATGPFVYVVRPDSTAELRPVTLGQRHDDLVVVAKGLAAGEQVVTTG